MKRLVVCFLLAMATIFLVATIIANVARAEEIKLDVNSGLMYEGHLSPTEFLGWIKIKELPCKNGHWHLLLGNPNRDADVKMVEVVAVEVTSAGRTFKEFFQYNYYYKGEYYIIRVDKKTLIYRRIIQGKTTTSGLNQSILMF